MKTVVKCENDEFLVITFKHVSGLTVGVNRPSIPKLWAIAHENGHKTRKRQFFGRSSHTCIWYYCHCKSSWNPKSWLVAHENGHQMRKLQVYGHISHTCIESYGPFISP